MNFENASTVQDAVSAVSGWVAKQQKAGRVETFIPARWQDFLRLELFDTDSSTLVVRVAGLMEAARAGMPGPMLEAQMALLADRSGRARAALARGAVVSSAKPGGAGPQLVGWGGVAELVHGVQVTARYDPRGVVRPEIIINAVPAIEVLDDVKIVERAGSKLFVLMADKTTRAFAIEGGAAAWATVVQNGKAEDLVNGAMVKIEYDPTGREGIKITLKTPPPQAAPAEDKGCGCSVYGGQRPLPWASVLFALGAVALVRRRRSR